MSLRISSLYRFELSLRPFAASLSFWAALGSLVLANAALGAELPAHLAGEPVICTNERNVKNTKKKVNLSPQEWETTRAAWIKIVPEYPGDAAWFQAGLIYWDEKDVQSQFKKRRDKRAHCYMGCRFAGSISYEAAHYMAWEKEFRDLVDCEARTYFEENDFTATIWGADYGRRSNSGSEEACFNYCAHTDFKTSAP